MNGTEVFLIDDPGRRGHLIGRDRQHPVEKVYQVRWHDNPTGWVPEYDLEREAAINLDSFGLTWSELEEILESFPMLKRRDIKRYRDYRTRLLLLDTCNRMKTALYADESHQILRNPSHCAPNHCHPARAPVKMET